jgi:hypothetical protein
VRIPFLPLVFVGLVVVYLLSGNTVFGYDGDIMYRVSESLVVRHSIQIADPYWQVNQPYAFYGIGTSLALLPLVSLGVLLAHDGRALVGVFEPIVTAASVIALYHVLVALRIEARRAILLALVYGLTTLAWHYTSIVFSEPLVGLGMLLALLALLTYRRTGQIRWLAAASAATGLTVLTRWDSLLLIALPVALYAAIVVRRRAPTLLEQGRAAVAWTLPLLAALALNLGYDWLRYGNPLSGGYAETPGFSTPLLTGLIGLLVSPGAGLLVYTPVLILAPLGYLRFLRSWRGEAILVAVLAMSRILFFARWWDFDGHSWGPRFLVPLLPLLLIPLAFARFGPVIRVAAALLVSAGFLIQTLGVLVPYEGMAFGPVQSQLLAQQHRQQVYPGCVLCSYRSETAVSQVIDFNWRYAPLVTQSQQLLKGNVYPVWTRFSPALMALLAALGLLLAIVSRRQRLRSLAGVGAEPAEPVDRRIA